MIAEKCHRKLGRNSGTWSGDNATWHISRGTGYTLCGHRIGSESKGWFIYNEPEKNASCLRCLKAIHKERK